VSIPASDNEFVLHGGRRSRLRNRAILLIIVIGIAVAVFINAVEQAKSDNAGSVGHLVVPAATAFGCLAVLVVTLSQWWEDATYLRVDGNRLGISHGMGAHGGRSTWFDRGSPIVLTTEGIGANEGLFASQADARIRLGDAVAVPPLQLAHLEGWLRGHGFVVERR